MILTKYQEAIFTVPTSRNRYDTHKVVMDYYSMGAPFDGRTFVYDVRVINDDMTAVTIRDTNLPDHFNPTNKAMEFKQGDCKEFMFSLNLVRRLNGKSIPVGCVDTFIKEKLTKAGWGDISIESCDVYTVPAKKKQHSLKLCIGRTMIKAKVIDPEKASLGFMAGIGRARGFGVGTMMINGGSL